MVGKFGVLYYKAPQICQYFKNRENSWTTGNYITTTKKRENLCRIAATCREKFENKTKIFKIKSQKNGGSILLLLYTEIAGHKQVPFCDSVILWFCDVSPQKKHQKVVKNTKNSCPQTYESVGGVKYIENSLGSTNFTSPINIRQGYYMHKRNLVCNEHHIKFNNGLFKKKIKNLRQRYDKKETLGEYPTIHFEEEIFLATKEYFYWGALAQHFRGIFCWIKFF